MKTRKRISQQLNAIHRDLMRVLPVILISLCIYMVDAEGSGSHLIARHRHLRSRQSGEESGELSIRKLVANRRHSTQIELIKSEPSQSDSRQYPKRRSSANDTFCSETIPERQKEENAIIGLVE